MVNGLNLSVLGRINFCNGSGANLWEYIAFEPRQDLRAITRGKSFALVVKPFPRDDLKRGLIRVQGCTSFRPLCRARVSTLRQQFDGRRARECDCVSSGNDGGSSGWE